MVLDQEPERKQEPQTYNLIEWDSPNSLNQPGSRLAPNASGKEGRPMVTLISTYKDS